MCAFWLTEKSRHILLCTNGTKLYNKVVTMLDDNIYITHGCALMLYIKVHIYIPFEVNGKTVGRYLYIKKKNTKWHKKIRYSVYNRKFRKCRWHFRLLFEDVRIFMRRSRCVENELVS